jgi:ribosome biogenesis protein YTM1
MEQIAVTFFTRQSKYAVTDAPVMVPVTLGRFGLSEIVNHLRGNQGVGDIGAS